MKKPTMRERLFEYAAERFGTEPEYLWSRLPNCAVLRRSDNNKWYAVIMDVDRSKLGLQGDGKTDVIDVKCSPMMTGSLIGMKGVLPAYHMNKENWISVLLDGSADEEQIMSLLDMSYELAGQSGKRLRRK